MSDITVAAIPLAMVCSGCGHEYRQPDHPTWCFSVTFVQSFRMRTLPFDVVPPITPSCEFSRTTAAMPVWLL